VRLAQAVGSPFDVTWALAYDALLQQICGARQQAQERTEAVIALATEHGFAQWLHSCGVEGIDHICRGMERLAAMGIRLMRPYLLGLLAEAYQCGGQVDDGLATLAEAVRIARATDESAITAPLYILQGELLLMQADTASAEQHAETYWYQALDVARRHQTKSWELRAALRLSRLWQRQGKRLQARQLLAPLYGCFTEGFETPDLQEAGALVHELA
jgi:predicted ATPase